MKITIFRVFRHRRSEQWANQIADGGFSTPKMGINGGITAPKTGSSKGVRKHEKVVIYRSSSRF